MGKRGIKSKYGLEWGSPTKKGYIRAYCSISGRQRMLHNIIWEREYGTIPKGYQVHHKNGIKSDNRIENLELLSALEHKRLHSGCFRNEQGEWIKPCRKCGDEKSIEIDFYKRKNGISPWCKDCCKENATINKRKRKINKTKKS
jgi:hypothetical protein